MRWVLVWVGLFVALGSTARADGVANLIIVVDPSMAPEKLSVVTTALTRAVADVPDTDQIAIITAGSTATRTLALQEVGDTTKVVAGLNKIQWSRRGNVAGGLRAATSLLAKLPSKARRSNTRIFVITDNETLLDVEKPAAALAKTGATISAISYQGANELQLGRLARGGGESEVVQSQDDLVDAVLDQTSLGPKPIALVLVIDRSASMQGPKLEAAKEAARVTVEVLAPNDSVAVVAFDTTADVIVRPTRASNRMRISNDITRLQAGGGTNIYPALKEAGDILSNVGRATKHVIVVSDGESPADGIADLVKDMHAAKIEISAVRLQGADRKLLTTITDRGHGRLYMVDDLAQLPKIFMGATGK